MAYCTFIPKPKIYMALASTLWQEFSVIHLNTRSTDAINQVIAIINNI